MGGSAVRPPGVGGASSWVEDPFSRRLSVAVGRGDLYQAELAAQILLQNGCSLAQLYDQVLRPLLPALPATQRVPVTVRQVQMLVFALINRLRPGRTAVRDAVGTVAVAARAGGGYVEGYFAGAVLEQRGWTAVHLGDVDPVDLDELAAGPAPTICVLVLQNVTAAEARAFARRSRAALPTTDVLALARPACLLQAATRRSVAAVANSITEFVVMVERLTSPLSERELDVLSLVSRGLSNKDIAGALAIGPATVKSDLDSAFTKLGCPDRASAVAQAIRSGWIL